mmetsp:Transcript_22356/g.46745  ORF Transcript_22356/g.46745 Transcript_22356/m.46745 type:complete len:259 (+) Transcript_22356:64-840(+)
MPESCIHCIGDGKNIPMSNKESPRVSSTTDPNNGRVTKKKERKDKSKKTRSKSSSSRSSAAAVRTKSKSSRAKETLIDDNHDQQQQQQQQQKKQYKKRDVPRMISTTQMSSLWDDIKSTTDESNDKNTYATDFESFGDNSLESWRSSDDHERNNNLRKRMEDGNKRALVACGDGIAVTRANITDASNVFIESVRAISLGAMEKVKKVGAYVDEREKAREEKVRQIEEEKRMRREQLLQEEMRRSRDELKAMAYVWRER